MSFLLKLLEWFQFQTFVIYILPRHFRGRSAERTAQFFVWTIRETRRRRSFCRPSLRGLFTTLSPSPLTHHSPPPSPITPSSIKLTHRFLLTRPRLLPFYYLKYLEPNAHSYLISIYIGSLWEIDKLRSVNLGVAIRSMELTQHLRIILVKSLQWPWDRTASNIKFTLYS